jgi:hypothetical protein
MIADSVFLKGSSHLNCEDYAISGTIGDNGAYAIVADGCSSGYRSDIAARMLALIAESIIRSELSELMRMLPDEVNHWFLDYLKMEYNYSVRYMIPPENMMSTLLIVISLNGKARTLMFGDGAALYHDAMGWHVYNVSFNRSAPRYPAYLFDHRLEEAYDIEFKDQTVSHMISMMGHDATVGTYSVLSPSGRFGAGNEFSLGPSDVDTVIITSDGLGTFEDGQGRAVDATSELVKFKSFTGEFIKRRALRFIEAFLKNGVNHYDDLGIAGIHI